MKNKNTKIGFICAIVSLVVNLWGILGIVALVFSVIGGKQEKATDGKMSGYALAGIIIGVVSLVFAVLNITVIYPMITTWIANLVD